MVLLFTRHISDSPRQIGLSRLQFLTMYAFFLNQIPSGSTQAQQLLKDLTVQLTLYLSSLLIQFSNSISNASEVRNIVPIRKILILF